MVKPLHLAVLVLESQPEPGDEKERLHPRLDVNQRLKGTRFHCSNLSVRYHSPPIQFYSVEEPRRARYVSESLRVRVAGRAANLYT